MKIAQAYRCKRMALGMTQSEMGKLLGVSGGTISRFENGEELSPLVFTTIRTGVEDYIRSLPRDQYIRVRLVEHALELEYMNDREKIITLNHMSIHCNKSALDLLQETKDVGEAQS